ncbi:MAG: di-trans,poly-cis-decaprenylcistransferase [Rhodospirillaceae bacterium]|nr:di-trans,poly-cis-decaprenylcistransferase [Rhodospirillaceae bacterium]|tara:strand:+ start:801 stop:1538 length:738 start_codon:yes stop_codon:yes gene_type:complete
MDPATATINQIPKEIPNHIAIIMDGNGRWAKARGLPRIAGHQKGAEALRSTIQACIDLKINYLTIYAFSSENWKRPSSEVSDLMALLQNYVKNEINEISTNKIKLNFIGERKRLDESVQTTLRDAEHKTKNNKRLTLTVALNYGGQQEILEAVKDLGHDMINGIIKPSDINEEIFKNYLQTSDIPEPDLLIRTSGEQRLSNFLLWQSAYTEFAFTPTLWPDFNRDCLESIIHEYQRRDRRYGGTG